LGWTPLVTKAVSPAPQTPGWFYNAANNVKHAPSDTSSLSYTLASAPKANTDYQITFVVSTLAGGGGTITPSFGRSGGTPIAIGELMSMTLQQMITPSASPSAVFSLTPSAGLSGSIVGTTTAPVTILEVTPYSYSNPLAPCYPEAKAAFPSLWVGQN